MDRLEPKAWGLLSGAAAQYAGVRLGQAAWHRSGRTRHRLHRVAMSKHERILAFRALQVPLLSMLSASTFA